MNNKPEFIQIMMPSDSPGSGSKIASFVNIFDEKTQKALKPFKDKPIPHHVAVKMGLLETYAKFIRYISKNGLSANLRKSYTGVK